MIAFRTWGKLLLAALGAGLLAGAGQLGLAYGLALVRFARSFDGTTRNEWAAQLSWVGWFAMVAAVAGALIGQRLARRAGLPSTTGSRVCLAVSAGLGAAMVAPLCMQPARMAQVASVSPVAATGLVALLGAVIGIVAAVAALTWRPVAWNVAAVVGVVWFLALISVMSSLGPQDPLPAVRLGVLDPAWLSAGTAQRLAVLVMPAVALAAGAGAAGLARWRGQPTVVVATAGLAGPVLLAAAYLLAGPGTGDRYQSAPYWGSLVGVGAGALASVVVAVLRWPLGGPAGAADPAADASTAIVPTDILRPIPGERLPADGVHRPRHADRDDPAEASTASRSVQQISATESSATGLLTGSGPAGSGTDHSDPAGSDPAGPDTGRESRTDPAPKTDRASADPAGTAPTGEAAPTALSDATSARLAWVDVAATDEPWAGAAGRPAASGPAPVPPRPTFHSQVIPAHQTSSWGRTGQSTPAPRTEDFWPAESAGSAAPTLSHPEVRTDDGWDAFGATNRPATSEPAPSEPAASEPAPSEPARTGSGSAMSARRRPMRRTGDRPEQAASPAGAAAPAGAGSTGWSTGAGAPGSTGTPDRTEPVDGRSTATGGASPAAATESTFSSAATGDTVSGAATTATSSRTADSRTAEAEPSAGAAGDQQTGRGRRGLFRRNRASGPAESAPAPDATADPGSGTATPSADQAVEPAPAPRVAGRSGRGRGRKARDEEYVDWVSGLADDPVDDRPAPDPGPRRTLRSSGRHHVD